MNLSRFFTLDELTFSNTAKAEGIDNQPTATEIEALRALCTAVLDPLREAVGKPIKVNSGYRGPALNRRVKGAAKSQHLIGEAADIQSPGIAVLELFKQVIRLGLPFDQIIYEVNGASKWVHVSHSRSANAGEIMLGKFDSNGKVTYPRLTAEQALALTEPTTRSAGPAAEPGYEEMGDEPPRSASKARSVKATAPAPAPAPAPKPKPAAKAPAAKKATAKKAPAKKASTEPAAAAKKAALGKPAARTAAVKKAPAKKVAAKKVAAKKAPAKKVPAQKAPAKKIAAKKVAAKQAPAKKVVAKKAPAQKATAQKAPAKKAPAKKAPVKQAPAKKVAVKKVVAKKVAAKKAPMKKAAAKKSS